MDLILLLVYICFRNTFNHNVLVIDGKETIYYVTILVLQSKSHDVVLEIGFPSRVKARSDLLTDSRHSSNVSGFGRWRTLGYSRAGPQIL